MIVADRFYLGVLFNVAQSGEVVGHFAHGSLVGGFRFAPFFECSDLCEGEGIALDCG